MTNLDIDQLASFVAIAETGSFTHAAERVHRTQSAVSLQMKRLEETVGAALFAREGRQSRLTDDGHRLLDFARRMLALNAETVAAFTGDDAPTCVTIGIPDDYATRLLPRILARFDRSHPNLEICVSCASSSEVAAKVRAGDVDLGIVTHGDAVEAFGAAARIIRREQLFWVGSPEHTVYLRDPVPLAVGPGDCSWRSAAVDAMAGCGRNVRIAYVSGSAAATSGAVVAGLAIGVLPESALNSDLRVLGSREGMPPLPTSDIALIRGHTARESIHDALAEHIIGSLDNLTVAIPA